MRGPGFVSPLSLIASALVILIVGMVTWLAGGILFSPGPLSARGLTHDPLNGVASHADLAANCGACHPAPWESGSMATRCLVCHTDVTAQLASGTGLHGVVSASDDDCRTCHTDHRGADGVLTEFQGDAALHERTRFSLAQHTKQADGSPFECATCHATSYASFDQAVCTDCHARLNGAFMAQHQADYGSDCIGCHDGKANLATFDHTKTHFPLEGQHSSVLCRRCHTGPSFAAAPTTCSACHAKDDAHKGQFGIDCGGCHKATAWLDVTFDHSKTAFPLDGRHLTTTCAQCHTNGVFKGTPTTCAACHQAPATHAGTFFTGGCADCHTTAGWKPATLSNHTFPIDHGGAVSDCAVCHPTNYGAYTCYGCHAHNEADIRARHLDEGITNVQDCVKCHPNGRGEGGG
jgi:hypothetical protein